MVAFAAIEADQPGMGMTNRVLPAQGEERGASKTLNWLDGDASRKFQSFVGEILQLAFLKFHVRPHD
jgi:hypothetical protein